MPDWFDRQIKLSKNKNVNFITNDMAIEISSDIISSYIINDTRLPEFNCSNIHRVNVLAKCLIYNREFEKNNKFINLCLKDDLNFYQDVIFAANLELEFNSNEIFANNNYLGKNIYSLTLCDFIISKKNNCIEIMNILKYIDDCASLDFFFDDVEIFRIKSTRPGEIKQIDIDNLESFEKLEHIKIDKNKKILNILKYRDFYYLKNFLFTKKSPYVINIIKFIKQMDFENFYQYIKIYSKFKYYENYRVERNFKRVKNYGRVKNYYNDIDYDNIDYDDIENDSLSFRETEYENNYIDVNCNSIPYSRREREREARERVVYINEREDEREDEREYEQENQYELDLQIAILLSKQQYIVERSKYTCKSEDCQLKHLEIDFFTVKYEYDNISMFETNDPQIYDDFFPFDFIAYYIRSNTNFFSKMYFILECSKIQQENVIIKLLRDYGKDGKEDNNKDNNKDGKIFDIDIFIEYMIFHGRMSKNIIGKVYLENSKFVSKYEIQSDYYCVNDVVIIGDKDDYELYPTIEFFRLLLCVNNTVTNKSNGKASLIIPKLKCFNFHYIPKNEMIEIDTNKKIKASYIDYVFDKCKISIGDLVIGNTYYLHQELTYCKKSENNLSVLTPIIIARIKAVELFINLSLNFDILFQIDPLFTESVDLYQKLYEFDTENNMGLDIRSKIKILLETEYCFN